MTTFAADGFQYENIRILVLEDEVHIRKIICRLLRQIGFRLIDEADNGVDGFRELLRVKPDMILCDIHMEPMDGMTFLGKLRGLNHPKLSKLPLIFLTADTNRETVVNAKNLRVDGYLAKPVSMNALKERIDAVLVA
jgi:two-component system chemotaxis response regulator CheY